MLNYTEEVDTLLVTMLCNILNDKTGRPLYRELCNRVLMTIFQVSAILKSLMTMGVVNMASLSASRTICSFLLDLAKNFVEARKYLALRSLATYLRRKGDVEGAQVLCAVLLINDKVGKSEPLKEI